MSALPFFFAPSSSAQANSQATLSTPVAVIAGNGGGDLGNLIDSVRKLQGTQNEPALASIATQASSPFPGTSTGLPRWVWWVAGGVALWLLLKRR